MKFTALLAFGVIGVIATDYKWTSRAMIVIGIIGLMVDSLCVWATSIGL